MTADAVDVDRVNRTRYVPGQREGHYESFYQRANHPTRPLACWIRYTLFSPKDHPRSAIGELWGVFFDGETGRHAVVKEEYPLAECSFDRDSFAVRLRESELRSGRLSGSGACLTDDMSWTLTYDGDEPPLYLLPRRLYDTGFPRAKNLVGLPLATYQGELVVNGRTVPVDGWIGSQAHNWGSRHTDQYAFAQVAGFDDAPGSFLEVVTARVRLGPALTPPLTALVLRHDGREHSLVSLRQALTASARVAYFSWDFSTRSRAVRVDGSVTAPREAFVGLNYYNPPGGIKHCLNTKLASAEVTVTDLSTGRRDVLRTRHRALFEILTDDREHGVPVRA